MEKMSHFPILLIIAPLLGAFLITIFGWIRKSLCFPTALLSITASLACALAMIPGVLAEGGMGYNLGGWMPPFGIAYRVDFLNLIILIAAGGVALFNLPAAPETVRESFPDKSGAFYTLYVLFYTGMCGILITGDAFNLYVLLEISSLTGYALIGMGDERSAFSGLNYVFMGTIGASFYLLGVGYLYLMTGTLNIADLAARLPAIYESPAVWTAFALCITGLFIKMALFPLHVWLPNAYSHAPAACAGLIAPLTTKVMVYVMIRVVLYIFGPAFAFGFVDIGGFIVWLAVIAIVTASLFALTQTSIRRLLSYIVIAEVGYMVGGFWLGNSTGITGAVLHIVNDAAMTLCVFSAAANIIRVKGSDRFADLTGLFRKMPFTMAAMTAGALSIIGVPPTCGFFSKWYLLSGGIEAGHWGFVCALLFSSLVNAVCFFRIFEIAFFEPFSDHKAPGDHESESVTEAPAGMLLPLLVTAGVLFILGIYAGDIAGGIFKYVALPAA